MSEDHDERAELLRKFQEVIDGAGLDELRELTGDLMLLDSPAARDAERQRMPELRRPPLDKLSVFRVRVDLKRSRPPIWRRLDIRSDLRLDAVHQVLQAAFSWDDYHLWRFSLGGEPFGRDGQLFLRPWDVQEGELEDEGGVPGAEVRLDEVMQNPGDVLGYLYDYGDNWELTLRLEQVIPASGDAPSALCVDGRRAAPPEDCGGLRDVEDLVEVLEDPARFEPDDVHRALRAPYFVLRDAGVDVRLVDLVNRLVHSSVGEDLTGRAVKLISEPTRPDDAELRDSLAAFTWFLDRAADDGLPLTAAGYMKPADVQAAAQVLPAMADWIGKANRETETTPVLHFRELLQELGLLRKYKGTLKLTKTGVTARASHEALWRTLAEQLVSHDTGFDGQATLLMLAYAATSANAEIPLDLVAAALGHLGWETETGEPIDAHDLSWLPAMGILENIKRSPCSWRDRKRISSPAAALAHAALHHC